MERKKKLKAAVLGMAVFLLSLAGSAPVFAMEAGTYTVTVQPSYTDPETGKVEDPGNNEAIGQGMTDRMCGSSGLLEVDESGNLYLTIRLYLSQFIRDVTIEERTGSSYVSRSYQETQTKAPIDGASDIGEKYGYTDYRMPVGSIGSVFRGNAYIDAMGRSVVFFFTASNPVKGSGDFVVTIQTAQSAQTAAAEAVKVAAAVEENRAAGAITEQNGEFEDTKQAKSQTAAQIDPGGDIFFVNGSGEVNDPVTGIPQKPSVSGTKTSGLVKAYQLDTIYDLSQVPLAQARKLTEPMLEKAVGITGITGDGKFQADAASLSLDGNESNPNKTVMVVLFGISAVLAVRFGAAMIQQQRRRKNTGIIAEVQQ